jgi:hypothetical protein
MSDLEFYASLAREGTVLGLGLGALPEEWAATLGSGFIDDTQKKIFRRDYGLIELTFERVDDLWRCRSISVQVHRLAHLGDSLVPLTLKQRYSAFARRLPSDRLVARLEDEGCQLEPMYDKSDSGYRRWQLATTGATVVAVTGDTIAEQNDMHNGDVWQINVHGVGSGPNS